jgi:hypothetical protein
MDHPLVPAARSELREGDGQANEEEETGKRLICR